MTKISAERQTFASPLPEWTSLARARFLVAREPISTTAQWLDFWEEKGRLILSQVAAADQQIKLRRPADDLRLSFRHGDAMLILDGTFGRVLARPHNATQSLQLHSSEACRRWRLEASFPRSMMILSQVAEMILGSAEAELQSALEEGRCSLWARPRDNADFEVVPPDRWRLYHLRPIIVRSGEKLLDGGRRQVWSKADPVDADGPSGDALYSIHVSVYPIAAPAPRPFEAKGRTAAPGARRGAPQLYDWSKIEAKIRAMLLAKGSPHRANPMWTKERFRIDLLDWCDQNGLGSPSTAVVDAHLNPIIAELEKQRPAKKLR